MKNASLLFSSLFVCILITSCQKELSYSVPGGSGNNGNSGGTGNTTDNIVGDYDFVGLTGHTNSTVTVTQAGQILKSVTTSDYITTANSGTVKITATDFVSTALGYAIDTVMHNASYLNNVLVSQTDQPFDVLVPASNSTSSYTRISSDSITVTGAFGVPDPSGTTSSAPVGVKLSWHGDTLYLKIAPNITQTITQGGIPGNFVGTVNGITRLKKR